MTWLEHTHKGLQDLFDMLPQQGVAFVVGTSIGFVTPALRTKPVRHVRHPGIPCAQLVRRIGVFIIPCLLTWALIVEVAAFTMSFVPGR